MTNPRIYERVGIDWLSSVAPRVLIKKNLATEGWNLYIEDSANGPSFVGTLRSAKACMLVADYPAKECCA